MGRPADAVPVPATLVLFCAGLVGLAGLKRGKNNVNNICYSNEEMLIAYPHFFVSVNLSLQLALYPAFSDEIVLTTIKPI